MEKLRKEEEKRKEKLRKEEQKRKEKLRTEEDKPKRKASPKKSSKSDQLSDNDKETINQVNEIANNLKRLLNKPKSDEPEDS